MHKTMTGKPMSDVKTKNRKNLIGLTNHDSML